MEAHCRMKALQREVGQVSSSFQMFSKTVDLCRGKADKKLGLVIEAETNQCGLPALPLLQGQRKEMF